MTSDGKEGVEWRKELRSLERMNRDMKFTHPHCWRPTERILGYSLAPQSAENASKEVDYGCNGLVRRAVRLEHSLSVGI